jgi:hypothetical protein
MCVSARAAYHSHEPSQSVPQCGTAADKSFSGGSADYECKLVSMAAGTVRSNDKTVCAARVLFTCDMPKQPLVHMGVQS